MDEKKLQLMKKIRAAESLKEQLSDDKFSDIFAEYLEKPDLPEVLPKYMNDKSKPSNMDPADWKKAKDIAASTSPIEVPFEKKVMKAEPGKITKIANEAYKKAEDLLPKERMAKLATKLGKRGLKAIPILGTGLGLMDAAEAALEGNYKKAGMEALSAIDPTPLTDIYMAGKEVVDAMEDQAKPLRKLAGEVESPDIEEMDNVQNYEEYLKKKKRQLGYE
jgi:DNA-directed RNA polymerase beta' subunit